ncbi:unnamed protein product [Rotaria sp. Silwood1]|nr:unnamed protein product [Rotaria sp. Silwood1]CAF4846933.1 unnamed protein product [Rotaria sp. Silwood1]
MLAGAGAGACTCQIIVTVPMELPTIRKITSTDGDVSVKITSARQHAIEAIRQQGFRGLYKSASATWNLDVFFSVIYFPLFSYLNNQRQSSENNQIPLYYTFISGIVASVVAGYLATPFDVDNTSTNGYTNYQTTSTDNCTGSVSICTQELPFTMNNPPDLWLDAKIMVPTIVLHVDNIQARLNLDVRVASLVNINAGVSVGISSVQLNILGVHANVQLAVQLDKIVEIVNRTLESIDLNSVLANTLVADTSNSTCPNNVNSVCTALPFNITNPPDVWLNVPNLSVDEISLIVEDLKAHVSLSANVASLVSLNAGVDISIDKVNLTILGVKAQVQLAVYLDNIAKIVTRTMASLDLNPLLLSFINGVFQTINNLLATFPLDGHVIHQIIDTVGNIVNQVLGPDGQILSSSIVGDYLKNMTFTGVTQTLANGYTIKQYSYTPPTGSSSLTNVLVNLVFNTLGTVVNAIVVTPVSPSTITNTPTTTATSSTPTVVNTTT